MNSKIKKVLMGIFIFFGSVIILLAALIIYLVFFSKSIDADKMTNNFDDFVFAYENTSYQSDMPVGLYIDSSTCAISEDGETYEYTLVIYNALPLSNQITANLYLNQDYIDTYGDKVTNPFFSVKYSETLMTSAEEYTTIRCTGVILDSKAENSTELFMENFSNIYLEILYGDDLRRIMVNVDFI